MLKIFCSALMLSLCLSLHAQSLTIGDTIPNIILNHLISYPQKSARLKDFNKHFLILDFWNIFCGSCIEAFPFLEKMEKQFSGKLQILLVNYESEETVKKFFEKRKLAGNYASSDPAVCSDTLLSRLFIHTFNPHYVWINEKGIVYAITGLQEMTEENIDAFIRGQPSVMAQKTDNRLPYDYEKPLFINGNGGSGESLLYHSILSGYVDKLSHLSAVICDSIQGYFITVTDQDIRSLYALAYDKGEYDKGRGVQGVPRNLTVFEVTDTSKYYGTIRGRYAPENYYCYDLRVPKAQNFNELKLLMKADLNRYFHLQAHFEKRKMPCWVLQSDDTSIVSSNGGHTKKNMDHFSLSFQNTPISVLTYQLQYYYLSNQPYPVIDDTGIKGGVNLKFYADMTAPLSIDAALAPFKMHLRKKERIVDVLVVHESPGNFNDD